MPVNYIELNNVKGYRWGKHGKFYPTKEFGEKGAREKAVNQGQAIKANESRELNGSGRVSVRASSRAKGYVKQI